MLKVHFYIIVQEQMVVPHLAQLCVASTSLKTNTLLLAAACLCTSSIFGSDLFNKGLQNWLNHRLALSALQPLRKVLN